jgi:hypothetical protein
MYYVIDNKRRVWGVGETPSAAAFKLKEIRKAIMARRLPRPPDPRTLHVVKFEGEPIKHREPLT